MIRRITNTGIPKTLYKYRDWNNKNHRRLISHQEIYFPRPSDFNDPFDGNIPVRWDLMTYGQCLEKNLEIINIVHKDKDQRQVREYAKKMTDEKTLWHPDKLAKERPEQLEKWNSIIGLFSLSAIPDNILMWSHYSSNHTGFVVGFDSESLCNDYDFDYLEPVNYQIEYPTISGLEEITDQFHKKFFFKSQLWEYEQEWRISKNHIEKRVVKLKKETINEILIGCKCNDQETHRIKRLIEKFMGTAIPIYKAMKLDEEFGLRMERIN
ncbi:MAG: DUF2971 domain-containing protein [Porphyromonadaceae bacterium]|nr:MAG: DUF2971 domain-containing protein [Porphyromonadaceae bacterium]